MDISEVLSALGLPARLGGRVLFIPRYCLEGFSSLRCWHQNEYAQKRYGDKFYWRIWLLLDITQLEAIEKIINDGSDAEISKLRETQLDSIRLVALVGALLASVALQALNLPEMSSTHVVVRAQFTLMLMLSVLATFFTCLQHRALSQLRRTTELRLWLSNGTVQTLDGRKVLRSSLTAHTLLDAPYELLTIAVANFLGGMTAYLGSAWMNGVQLSQGAGSFVRGDGIAIVYFGVGTGFAFTLFPLLLGSKTIESKAGKALLRDMDGRDGWLMSQWAR